MSLATPPRMFVLSRSASGVSNSICTSCYRQLRGLASRPYQTKSEIDEERRRLLGRHLRREWQQGDIYAPHDLSAAEMRKWQQKKAPTRDVFDILNVNPLTQYKNFSLMSDFVTEMGRIRPRSETGLRPVNQRKIAKAVRRAIALGLMPSVYKHPEILKRQIEAAGNMR